MKIYYPRAACVLSSDSVHACTIQIWVSSPEGMSGTIKDAAKIVEYEERWHADIFVPCLKKLGTEVCMHVHEFMCR